MRPRRTVLGLSLLLLLTGCGDSTETAGPEADPSFVSQTEGAAEEEDEAGEEEGEADPGTGAEPEVPQQPGVALVDADGQEVGTVRVTETDDGTQVEVEVSGLNPGFHGLHVHAVGRCEPGSAAPDDPAQTGDFLSAGGHLGEGDHGDHAGDLPSVYVDASGAGRLVTMTDRFTGTDLYDTDGAALVVHADPDNFAHIPERYGAPDEDTLRAGDAGDRVACAVLEE